MSKRSKVACDLVHEIIDVNDACQTFLFNRFTTTSTLTRIGPSYGMFESLKARANKNERGRGTWRACLTE